MPYKAFVSSTYEDLKEHRKAAIDRLRRSGFSVDPMEEWTASADEPKMLSQDRLDGCDVCILLVAFRRGHVPNGEDLSITQLEIDAAGNAEIDVLVFMLDEDAPWVARFDERDSDPGVERWRSELLESHTVERFGLDAASLDIAPALNRWIATRHGGDTDVRASGVHGPMLTFDEKHGEWRRLSVNERTADERIIDKGAEDGEEEVLVLGLPRTGKTTVVKSTIAHRASGEGRPCVYIPDAGHPDLEQLLDSCPLPKSEWKNAIFAFDEVDRGSFTVPVQAETAYLVLSEPPLPHKGAYSGRNHYVTPLEIDAQERLLQSVADTMGERLPRQVLRHMSAESGGLPGIPRLLLEYYFEHGRMPRYGTVGVDHAVKDEISSTLQAVEHCMQSDQEASMLLAGLFAVAGGVPSLYRRLQLGTISNTAKQIENLGLKRLACSRLLREAFVGSGGDNSIKQFLREGFRILKPELDADFAHVWTPDFQLQPCHSVVDLATQTLRQHAARVDWENVLINGRVSAASAPLKTGDRVQFILTRRPSAEKQAELTSRYGDDIAPALERSARTPNDSRKRRNQIKLIKQADRLCYRRQYGTALGLYRQATRIRVDSKWAQVRLANLLRLLGQVDEAEHECQSVLRSTPNPHAEVCRGICRLWVGDIDAAKEAFARAVALRSNYRNAKLWLARCEFQDGDQGRSEKLLTEIAGQKRHKVRGAPNRRRFGNPFAHEFLSMLTSIDRKYARFESRLESLSAQVGQTHQQANGKINQHAPLFSLYSYLAEKEVVWNRLKPEAKRACEGLPGLVLDTYAWVRIVPWDFFEERAERRGRPAVSGKAFIDALDGFA